MWPHARRLLPSGESSKSCSPLSRGRAPSNCTRLVTTHKCVLSAAVYYNKMKGFADGMVAAGKPLEDDDFISYVLVRLDHDYNSSVGNVTSKTGISLGTLYSLFLAAEARLDPQSSQYQSSANVAMHDRALQESRIHSSVPRNINGLYSSGSSVNRQI
jgi:hypothetical protein